jgi:hypothetical protein
VIRGSAEMWNRTGFSAAYSARNCPTVGRVGLLQFLRITTVQFRGNRPVGFIFRRRDVWRVPADQKVDIVAEGNVLALIVQIPGRLQVVHPLHSQSLRTLPLLRCLGISPTLRSLVLSPLVR